MSDMQEAFREAAEYSRRSIKNIVISGVGFITTGLGVDNLIDGNYVVGTIETVVGGSAAYLFGKSALGEAKDAGYTIGKAEEHTNQPPVPVAE